MRRRNIAFISYLLIVSIICGLFIIPTASHAKVWIYRECQFAEPGEDPNLSLNIDTDTSLQETKSQDSSTKQTYQSENRINILLLYSNLLFNHLFGFIF